MNTLLAGDIGGTKTLLSLVRPDGGDFQTLAQERYPSGEWSDLAPMVRHFLAGAAGAPGLWPAAACFAVAGPVDHGVARLTNLSWILEEERLREQCALPRVELINDFAVLVHGLPHLGEHQWTTVHGGQAREGAPVLLLGAGTGLGVALGVPTPSGTVALPSEGAHGSFAPRSRREWELMQWLRADLCLERVSIERVVSGTGLGHVARWLLACRHPGGDHPLSGEAARWQQGGVSGGADLPAAVAAAAAGGDPLAMEALDLWLGAYGAAAGDLALTTLPQGGIWLAGGTAAKLIAGLRSPAFRGAFLGKGRLRPALEPIPIRALTDPAMGTFSAACRARMLPAGPESRS